MEPRYELNIDFGTIKKGTEFGRGNSGIVIDTEAGKIFSDRIVINNDSIDKFLADGIIRKVEEPKWTDSDMIEKMDYYGSYVALKMHERQNDIMTAEDWLKSKQEEGK